MKLLEAMKIINAAGERAQPTREFALACSFTPLSVATFLQAHLQTRSEGATAALTQGRYGDLEGSLERAAAIEALEGSAVIIEWEDLDRRLGYRHAAPMGAADVGADVARTTDAALTRLLPRIEALGRRAPLALCLPTLPLPPIFLSAGQQAGPAELTLRAHLSRFAEGAASLSGVRIVSAQRLDAESPLATRLDVASDLRSGFPYQRAHAERVAALLAALLRPAPAKKGLITDLDDTFWRGILGEVGVQGVMWTLDGQGQVHGLYQQLLASLAESGTLVAVASKNDPALAAEALRRADLLVGGDRLFPVHAAWSAKSEGVRAILRAWNVGADSVVFVDDSPLELAEVQASFPDIECLRFTPDDPGAVLALVARLRDAFGRDVVREEDRLRAASLRASGAVSPAGDAGTDAEGFLSGLAAEVSIDLGRDAEDGRALELVNKTNQFNLNGRRVGAGEWRRLLAREGAFLLTVGYSDRFGPLGKIGVAFGTVEHGVARLEGWVMSCRAFARRIEHQTMRALFEGFGVDAVELDYVQTERNGPLREFLAALGASLPEERALVRLERADFVAACPVLHHAFELERDEALAGLGEG